MSPDAIVRDNKDSKSGRYTDVRSEENSTDLKKEVVDEVLEPRQLVLDSSAGTLSTAKTLVLVERQRHFVECDKDV